MRFLALKNILVVDQWICAEEYPCLVSVLFFLYAGDIFSDSLMICTTPDVFFVCFLFCGMDATCFVGGVVECDLFCCSYCCSFAAMLYYPALLGDTDSAIRS